jgi:hypothetical protein
MLHDNPDYGNFGNAKTTEFDLKTYISTSMDTTVGKYIAGYESCHHINTLLHDHPVTYIPPPALEPPCERHERNITGAAGTNHLRVYGNHRNCQTINIMAIYHPSRKDIDVP